MRVKSAKRKVAKQKRGAPANGGREGPGGGFWTQRIEPKGTAFLSQTLMPCHFVIKNHGSANMRLVAQQGDHMDLPPGAVRATYAHGSITVENPSDEAAHIEFEILPILRK
jgi:hypothetical protein